MDPEVRFNALDEQRGRQGAKRTGKDVRRMKGLPPSRGLQGVNPISDSVNTVIPKVSRYQEGVPSLISVYSEYSAVPSFVVNLATLSRRSAPLAQSFDTRGFTSIIVLTP